MPHSTKTVLVPITTGTEDIELSVLTDTLRRGGLEVTVAAVGGHKTVKLARGLHVTADVELADIADKDFTGIYVPGGPGAKSLGSDSALILKLKAHATAGRSFGGVCAAPSVVLAANGLLDGVRATCYPSDALVAAMPDYEDAPVVVADDGRVITGAGPFAAFPWALAVVKHLQGEEKAKEVAKQMLVPDSVAGL